MSSTVITASCHCKAHSFTNTIPTSSLPLSAHLCHCTSCRRVSGTLYTTAAPWPSLPSDHTLQRYEFTKATHVLFCGTCSQKMFWHEPAKDKYQVLTACLPHDKNLAQYRDHIFVGDTIDGGYSAWLTQPHPETAATAMPTPRWSGPRDTSELLDSKWPADYTLKDEHDLTTHGDELPVRCHCGGVDLRLARPDYSAVNDDDVPWFVDPMSRRKWTAISCVCDSCRSTFSADVVPLAFVELTSIHSPSTSTSSRSPFPDNVTELADAVAKGDPVIGTLASYQSSATVVRYHCKRCSASVFYTSAAEDRRQLIDLAVGLIDSPDGARAEGMLWWQFTNGDGGSMVQDVRGGWRAEIASSFRAQREAWRAARGWRVDDEADEESRAQAARNGDMLI